MGNLNGGAAPGVGSHVEGDVGAVRSIVARAKPVRSLRAFAGDPQPGAPRDGVNPGQWTPDELGLPPDCPVVPLGVDGTRNWFLDPIGQLYCYAKPYGQADTIELFRGRHLYLYWAWPKWGKKAEEGFAVDGWRNEKARETLIAACTAMGPWSAVERVRGRGVWPDGRGGIVVHCGDTLYVDGRRLPPGRVGEHVYPTRPPVAQPPARPVEDGENPARRLRTMLSSWAWSRPDVDPQLLLGWIGVAFLGAALPWRSVVFITGDKAAGKSTLQAVVKGVLGDRLIQSSDTSAAGIYQRIGQDCLPVAVDELEGESDVRQQKKVLKLARVAASGDLMLRGGDSHQGVEFQARSAFLFSSINTPPLEPQDLSRMALLRLHRLPAGQAAPEINPATLGLVGETILRRLIDQWHRFDETWRAFKGELAAGGMDGRAQDTFGTLLACADLIEFDGWDPARLSAPSDGDMRPWRELMAAAGMAEFEDATENWRACLNHLLSAQVEAWRHGTRQTVGEVLEAWWAGHDDFIGDLAKVRRELGQAGLTLQRQGSDGDWLAIPNQGPLTRRLFEGTKWQGEFSAGVWAGALRQAPRGTVYEVGSARVNGVKCKCTLIRLSALYGEAGMMTEDGDG